MKHWKRRPFAGWLGALLISLNLVALAAPQPQVVDLLWCPNGERLAAIVVTPAQPPSCALQVIDRSGQAWTYPERCKSLRLLGWTRDGSGVVVDLGTAGIRVVAPARSERVLSDSNALVLASDGTTIYYFSRDRSHLMAQKLGQEPQVVAVLPPGTRPSAALSPDGQHLALRRSVRQGKQWETEIWVLSQGIYRKLIQVPSPFARVHWHPSEPGLLINVPSGQRQWDVYIAWVSDGQPAQYHARLPSPAQWDRSGRAYFAAANGLSDLATGETLHQWMRTPSLWVVSPDGRRLATSTPDGAEPVRLSPLAP